MISKKIGAMMEKEKALELLDDLILRSNNLIKQYPVDVAEATEIITSCKSFANNIFKDWEKKVISIEELGIYPTYTNISPDKFDYFVDDINQLIGLLRSWKSEIDSFWENNDQKHIEKELSFSCFIVHGHNNEIKLEVSRFIEKDLKKDCIILHEQPNAGRSILEKFEEHSEVDFAVCLWSADDLGKAKSEMELNPRIRQNVMLETGFFWGKFERKRIIVIYEDGVELPSDYNGLLFIPFKDNWKDDLRKEIENIYTDNQEGEK